MDPTLTLTRYPLTLTPARTLPSPIPYPAVTLTPPYTHTLL